MSSSFPSFASPATPAPTSLGSRLLLDAGIRAIERIARATAGRRQLVVVGAPIPVGNSLFNCAVVICDGAIRGIVPKQHLPNYKEYYEHRWFRPARGTEPDHVDLGNAHVPFGIDLLFEAPSQAHPGWGTIVVGVEICEDLWVPLPPSSLQAMAGATILLNISASNETIGKSRYRTDLVVGQSGRAIAAYCLAGAGPSESTTDVVFSGHCLIAENGRLLAESPRVGDGLPLRRDSYLITHDVDAAKLQSDRRLMTSFDGMSRHWQNLSAASHSRSPARWTASSATYRATPFVPSEGPELHRRCAEIFGIQCAGLAKRIERLSRGSTLNIGISGGLDSTLAVLVAVTTCDMLGIDRRQSTD